MSITDLNLNKVTLELFKRRIQSRVSDQLLAGMQYKEFKDEVIHQMICSLEYEVFGIKRTIKKEIKRPIDWWNAIKERFFPKWLLKRFPVNFEMIPIDIEVWKVCPHLNRAVEYDHVSWFVQDNFHESDWKEDKSFPLYLRETIIYLETAAYMLENTNELLAHDLQLQAKKLKEIV